MSHKKELDAVSRSAEQLLDINSGAQVAHSIMLLSKKYQTAVSQCRVRN